ncbi:MAG: hypothetical protein WD295_02450, partial [Bacteroidota bacterium]
MSIYDSLKTERPKILYSAIHQVKKGTRPEEYRKTMQDLHALIREQSHAVSEEWRTTLRDLLQRESQVLRGNLTQFLTTPLKSDFDEIEKTLREHVSGLLSEVVPFETLGVLTTVEGRMIPFEGSGSAGKKLVTAGKSLLLELGFQSGKAKGEIYESQFVVDGGLNLDIIEHLVRDRIGIYTPVHGKHIQVFDSYSYAAHNLVYLSGDLGGRAAYEASIHFSKGETRYAPFRNGAGELLDEIREAHPMNHMSLWQRKLGLGTGREFVLRLRTDNPALVVDVFETIRS